MLSRLDSRLGELRPDALTTAAIVGAFGVAGLIAGYVIASGKPIPIALTLGAIAGIALLSALPLVIWIILVGVLLISGQVAMFVPALEKASWLFALLGFFLTGAAILYPAVARQHFTRPMPAFVLMAISLLVLGMISIAYSGGTFSEWFRAVKRYFQFFGVLFILAVVPFSSVLIRRWWLFLVILAILQLPFALYQRFVLVPSITGTHGFPLDIVVGTMEGSLLSGGSSSVMALLLVSVLSYLVAAYRERILTLRNFLLLTLVAAIPLTLGQVALIVILLPLALAAVSLDLMQRHPLRFALGAVMAVALFVFGGWAYLLINSDPTQSVAKMVEDIIAYNFGNVGYFGSISLNRSSIYPYWLQHQSLSDPVGFLLGHGLGSSFGGVGEPNPGHMDQAHSHLFIGLTTASSLLWDLGLIGFLLVVGIPLSAASYASRLAKTAQPGFDRALCRTLYAMALMFAVMNFYSTASIAVPSQEVLSSLTLGLIAWRWRNTWTASSEVAGFRATPRHK